eukprot:6172125-Pleurochrysis_carterae.AAC.1
MQIKGKKKTAWSGVYYNDEGHESDITGWEVILPDGTKIPQLTGTETYKYLGTQLRPGRAKGSSIKQMRRIIAEKSKRIIYAIGRLPGLTQKQLGSTLALGVAGVLGYYARSTPMDMTTCNSIEEARARVLRAAGYSTGAPRGQIYHAGCEGGMDTHEHAFGVAAAAYCDQIDRAICGPPERTDHTQVAEALAETCYRLGCRGISPLVWRPTHLLGELDETRMMEAYLKYKLTLGIDAIQTSGVMHEALRRKKWSLAPRTPRLWEEDELVTPERKITTKPITFHRTLAEMSIAEWADIYDGTTREYYTMGGLCKKYRVKKSSRISQEYSNVKRLHNRLLQETEQGALGIIWGRNKEELLRTPGEQEHKRKVSGVREKRRTAECWGGEEYLIECDDGEQRWVNKQEVENMNGTEIDLILKAKELITEGPVSFAEHMIDYGIIEAEQHSWGSTWREFLIYAQKGDRGRSAKNNVRLDEQKEEICIREPYPTLYPGEVEGESEEGGETGHQRRNMRGLTDRAKRNQQRRARREEGYKNKKIRLMEGGNGTRKVSARPEQRPGGGEWELPTLHVDTAARRLMGGLDGRGLQRVLKDETMDPAHDEKYAGHPILRLFTRPAEMENGTYMGMAKEDVTNMNSASGKKLTYDTLNVAMTLHERYAFHLAVATDGSKKRGTTDRGYRNGYRKPRTGCGKERTQLWF